MLEENRKKALIEIKSKLEENERARNIITKLNSLLKQNLYDEYIDLIIKEQPLIMKYNGEAGIPNMVGINGCDCRNIAWPNDEATIKNTFKKYVDDNNPIYFYPVSFWKNHQVVLGYRNLETEREMDSYDFEREFHFGGAKKLELGFHGPNFFTYQRWYFSLLYQHTVDETYEILKKLAESETSYHKILGK